MHLVCPHCGATNRVPEARLNDQPKCGSCKQLLTPTEPVALSDAQLVHYLSKTEQPILVDFWASWCGPCQMMAPIFAEAAAKRPGVRFIKVDSDAAPVASRHFGIRSVPSLLLFRGGQEVARLSGAMPAAQLLNWLDQQLS